MRILDNVWALPTIIALAVIIVLFLLIKSRSKVEETNSENMEGQRSIRNSSTEMQSSKGPSEEEDMVLVAAIMAALCSFSGKSPSELNIKSIRRTDSSDSSWRREAISKSVRH